MAHRTEETAVAPMGLSEIRGSPFPGARAPGYMPGLLRSPNSSLKSRGINRLPEDGFPQPQLDDLRDNEVDGAVEEILEKRLQVHIVVERLGSRLELYQEVEVTLDRGFPSRLRAKKTEAACSVGSDRIAVPR